MSDPFGPIRWFDPSAVRTQRGMSLPHFQMPDVVYFITFRLFDSLPEDVYVSLLRRRDAFLIANPLPHTSGQEHELKCIYDVPLARYLDRGLGSCVLKDMQARQQLTAVLTACDGDRYQLGDWVIMPNHVHLLARLAAGTDLRRQCRSWKNLSAARINAEIGRKGKLWQPDSFDHIVRSPAKLKQIRRYIEENPQALPPEQYSVGTGSLQPLLDAICP